MDNDRKQVLWRSLDWKPAGTVLNLACGSDYRDGWVNVDYHYDDADVRHDLFHLPWPFQDATADAILVDNYLEHVPHRLVDGRGRERDGLLATMEECHRILKPGGTILIAVPYANSPNDLHNPVHYRSMIPETLSYLWSNHENEPTQKETVANFELVRIRVRRYFGTYRFNTQYHVPKYFGFTVDWIGRKWEIVWVLRKPSP